MMQKEIFSAFKVFMNLYNFRQNDLINDIIIKNEGFEFQTPRSTYSTLYNEKSASAGRTFGILWINSLALS